MTKISKNNRGFSMVEIVIALLIISCGFLPIFNLFKQNNASTVNNIQETQATNYASDLINFCKDLRYTDVVKHVDDNTVLFEDDDKTEAFFKKFGLKGPIAVTEPFSRSLELRKFEVKSFKQKFSDFFRLLVTGKEKYSVVPSFLVTVKVKFPRLSGKGTDEVVLYTIIMD